MIDRVNAKVASTEGMKKYLILDRDLSLEARGVPPTLKVKRNLVAARYRELPERLYD
jgi:long-chain acyl-CoA synthetase